MSLVSYLVVILCIPISLLLGLFLRGIVEIKNIYFPKKDYRGIPLYNQEYAEKKAIDMIDKVTSHDEKSRITGRKKKQHRDRRDYRKHT